MAWEVIGTPLLAPAGPPIVVPGAWQPIANIRGPAGPPGAGFYYEHVQVLPSAGWTIVHMLGLRPNVSVIIGGEVVNVPVEHIDLNTAHVTFSTPQTGSAACS